MEETKKELSAYIHEQELLKDIEDEIKVLITKATNTTTELSDMPKGTPEEQDKMAKYTSMLVDTKNKKIDQLTHMYKVKNELEEKIFMLEQPYKNILYYKYIKGYNLTKVANKIRYNYKWTCELHGDALIKYKELDKNG